MDIDRKDLSDDDVYHQRTDSPKQSAFLSSTDPSDTPNHPNLLAPSDNEGNFILSLCRKPRLYVCNWITRVVVVLADPASKAKKPRSPLTLLYAMINQFHSIWSVNPKSVSINDDQPGMIQNRFRGWYAIEYKISLSGTMKTMRYLSLYLCLPCLLWTATSCYAYDITQPRKQTPPPLPDDHLPARKRSKTKNVTVILSSVRSGAVGAIIGSVLAPQNLVRQWVTVSAAGTVLLISAATCVFVNLRTICNSVTEATTKCTASSAVLVSGIV